MKDPMTIVSSLTSCKGVIGYLLIATTPPPPPPPLMDQMNVNHPHGCHHEQRMQGDFGRSTIVFWGVFLYSDLLQWILQQNWNLTEHRKSSPEPPKIQIVYKIGAMNKRYTMPPLLSRLWISFGNGKCPNPYLIFVTFFTLTLFEPWKVYTQKCVNLRQKLPRDKTAWINILCKITHCVCKTTKRVYNYTLCVIYTMCAKLHTVCIITHCV